MHGPFEPRPAVRGTSRSYPVTCARRSARTPARRCTSSSPVTTPARSSAKCARSSPHTTSRTCSSLPPPPGSVTKGSPALRSPSRPRTLRRRSRLYWNRLDFRQTKLGEGPLIRRPEEDRVQADCPHEALIPGDWFARTQADMARRRTHQSRQRRRPQQRFFLLRGVVHCATGHNACGCTARNARASPTTPAATTPPTAKHSASARTGQVAVHPRGPAHRPHRPLLWDLRVRRKRRRAPTRRGGGGE